MPSLNAKRAATELLRNRMRASLLRDQPQDTTSFAAPPSTKPPIVAPQPPEPPVPDPPPIAAETVNGPTPLSDRQPLHPLRRHHRRNPDFVLTVTRANGSPRKAPSPKRQAYLQRRREGWIDVVASMFSLLQDGRYDVASVFAEQHRDMIKQAFFDKKTKQEVIDMLAAEFGKTEGSIAAE